VPKQKRHGKTTSVWEEPEEEDDPALNCIFHTKTDNSIRKSAPHAFLAPNPNFHCQYNADKDAKELHANLVLGRDLSQDIRNRVTTFVQEFRDVFRKEGVKIPIRGYEMAINTGDHKPIAVCKLRYGLLEIPIMQKKIDKLLEMMFIRQEVTSPWASQITLAPGTTPHGHQRIHNMEIMHKLNQSEHGHKTSRIPGSPMQQSGDVWFHGEVTLFILLDTYSGYDQVKLSEALAQYTVFFTFHGCRYCWVGMPF
jgi:hypothetical protein